MLQGFSFPNMDSMFAFSSKLFLVKLLLSQLFFLASFLIDCVQKIRCRNAENIWLLNQFEYFSLNSIRVILVRAPRSSFWTKFGGNGLKKICYSKSVFFFVGFAPRALRRNLEHFPMANQLLLCTFALLRCEGRPKNGMFKKNHS